MNAREIYEKTAAGVDEVQRRSRGLPPRLRTMLIMVDGVRTVAQLDLAAQTLDAPRDYLQRLLSQDLVRLAGTARPQVQAQPASVPPVVHEAAPPVPARASVPPLAPAAPPAAEPLAAVPATDAERFRAAQKLMNDCAVDTLGLRAFLWTLKLEKASTVDDLRRLLPDYCKAIAKARGEAAAALLDTRVRSMLG